MMKAVEEFAFYRSSMTSTLHTMVQVYQTSAAARGIILTAYTIGAIFILLHISISILRKLVEIDYGTISPLRLDEDGGYPERLNYIQTAGCAVLLMYAFMLSREAIYAAWALVYGFVVADDMLMLHETIGQSLSASIDLPALPGLRPQDTGELMVWGAAGLVLMPALVIGFLRSSHSAKGFGMLFGCVFAVLLCFGVVVDMFHTALNSAYPITHAIFTVAEDGGEMLALTAALALSLLLSVNLYRQRSTARAPARVMIDVADRTANRNT